LKSAVSWGGGRRGRGKRVKQGGELVFPFAPGGYPSFFGRLGEGVGGKMPVWSLLPGGVPFGVSLRREGSWDALQQSSRGPVSPVLKGSGRRTFLSDYSREGRRRSGRKLKWAHESRDLLLSRLRGVEEKKGKGAYSVLGRGILVSRSP